MSCSHHTGYWKESASKCGESVPFYRFLKGQRAATEDVSGQELCQLHKPQADDIKLFVDQVQGIRVQVVLGPHRIQVLDCSIFKTHHLRRQLEGERQTYNWRHMTYFEVTMTRRVISYPNVRRGDVCTRYHEKRKSVELGKSLRLSTNA